MLSYPQKTKFQFGIFCPSLTPKVHGSPDVDQREQHSEEDLDGGEEVGEHEQRRHKDAGEGQANVPVQLPHDDLEI